MRGFGWRLEAVSLRWHPMTNPGQPSPFVRQTIETPLGGLMLVVRDDRLCMAEFADCDGRIQQWLRRRTGEDRQTLSNGVLPFGVERAFHRYFDGELRALEAIDVELSGTPFQTGLWTTLRTVPPGKPLAYGAFAASLGRPRAARAVGHANGANPLAIIVPCHRLVGADGALVDYGGGLWRKRWLLDHEQRHASQS